jgi:hypothetical protein
LKKASSCPFFAPLAAVGDNFRRPVKIHDVDDHVLQDEVGQRKDAGHPGSLIKNCRPCSLAKVVSSHKIFNDSQFCRVSIDEGDDGGVAFVLIEKKCAHDFGTVLMRRHGLPP